ncbi:MAG TPA: ROK family transcriptional regulator [Spirochaetia bacterium]|nr:ROK family transcriptional regulator [Spirochaetia bacterium]
MNGNNIGDQKGSKLAIIQALRAQGPVSRIDLTRLTGLSRATVSLGVGELIQTNLVRETAKNEAARGRPATLLELMPRSNVILGADFGARRWTLGAFDLMGNSIAERSIAVAETDPSGVVGTLIKELPGMINELPVAPLPLIGLGLPGLVNTEQGVIFSASDLGWQNVEIGRMMSDALGWPTVALNRHRARGLAECRYGAARTYHQVIYIGVSTGIAAGIYQDRKLVTGAFGGAGEIGHLTVDPNGPLCPCGNHGCLQLVAAAGALETDARRLLRDGKQSLIMRGPGFDLRLLRAEDICAAADQGDPISREVVGRAAEYLGIAMANLVNVLNPEMIVLGGPIPTTCDYYVECATATMRRRAMAPLTASIEVRRAELAQLGGALGAATFALDQNLSYSLFR